MISFRDLSSSTLC